jgi:hypothetical protein
VTYECWAKIPWAADLYEVSDQGRVRSRDRLIPTYGPREYIKPGRVLRQAKDRNGYCLATLCVEGKRRGRLVHRLVWEAHASPLIAGMDIAHLDGNPANNVLANLVQCSRQENVAHQIAHGTRICGESKPAAKLTTDEVREIRRLYAVGAESYRSLGRRFGVSSHTIGVIVHERGWRAA